MKNTTRIFGTGPLASIASIIVFFIFYLLKNALSFPTIFDENNSIRFWLFLLLTLISILMIIFSFKTLTPKERGRTLIVTGIYKYFRHPLYAAFLSVFNFGLAILLNNWIYIIWAFSLHPLWHILIRREEEMLKELFPVEYENYCKKTGRFFPKIKF